MQRLRELNQLSQEEEARIRRLRTEVDSPTEWAERAEQEARKKIQPLLDQVKMEWPGRAPTTSPSMRQRWLEQASERAMESAEQVSEALLEDLLDEAATDPAEGAVDREAQRRLQAPTLESMLLRMEEIQKDEEEVRMRFATITYADPLSWSSIQAAGSHGEAVSSGRSSSPQPLRLTRPVLRHSPVAHIMLGQPVETGHSVLSESSSLLPAEGEAIPQDAPGCLPGSGRVFPGPAVEQGGRTVLTVPGDTLKSIRLYREQFDAYLRLVAHEPVGSFNPWAIADGLAEELLEEAVASVAAEFQDVCEDYAEAVFTSEFLQPVQSPPASVPPPTPPPAAPPLGLV